MPAAYSFKYRDDLFFVNLLLHMSVSRRNELYPKRGHPRKAGQCICISRKTQRPQDPAIPDIQSKVNYLAG
jgi:hypothetical protein